MQVLRDPNVISYVVELVQNITKKNMRLSLKKTQNLARLEKNVDDKANKRVLKTKQANNIIMPNRWFDVVYAKKEEYMEQQSNSEANNLHPNSIQALLDEDQRMVGLWSRLMVN